VLASLERLHHLELDDFYSYTEPPDGDGWFRTLASSPAVDGLRSLSLTRTGVDIEALCSSARLARLETLRLVDQAMSPAGARTLAASPLAASLRSLTLSGCFLGDQGLVPLAESPALRTLQRLALHHEGLTEAGAATLARSLLVGLTHLDVSHNDLRDAGVRALLSSPVLHRLRVLRVSHNRLSARYDGVAHTEAFRALPHLVEFAGGQQSVMTRSSHQLHDREVDHYWSSTE
jgi:Ran GTPase-activating protein (RanGAP) involved in mRNA processing and transport